MSKGFFAVGAKILFGPARGACGVEAVAETGAETTLISCCGAEQRGFFVLGV